MRDTFPQPFDLFCISNQHIGLQPQNALYILQCLTVTDQQIAGRQRFFGIHTAPDGRAGC